MVAARRGDSAPEAGDRARSGLRDGAGAAVGRLRQHRSHRRRRRRSRGGRSSCATGSASASGSSSRGATTSTRRRPGTRRSTLARSWTATYPREAFAFNSLGLASAAFGQHDEAVRAFREAIRLDPKFVPPHRNLDRVADRAQPVRRSAGGPARGGRRRASSFDRRSGGWRTRLAFLDNDRAGHGARARSARDASIAAAGSSTVGSADVGVLRTVSRRRTSCFSAASRPRCATTFHELGGAVDARGCRTACDRRPVRRGAAGGRGGARARSRQFHARAGEPRAGAVRTADGVRGCRPNWPTRFPERDADHADSAAGDGSRAGRPAR